MIFSELSSPYDPDGECFQDIVFRLCKFFEVESSETEISNATSSNIFHTSKHLKSIGLDCQFNLHPLSFFSPLAVKWFIKNRNLFTSNEGLCDIFSKTEKIAVILQSTYFALYGIPENWYHFTCLVKLNSHEEYYDGLFDQLVSEGESPEKMPKPRLDAIMKKSANRILVWKK